MFTRLLASDAPAQRSGPSLVVSVGAHLAIGAGAIMLTAARNQPPRSSDDPVSPVYVAPPTPATLTDRAPGDAASGAPAADAPVAAMPRPTTIDLGLVVPSVLPDVSVPLSRPSSGWTRIGALSVGTGGGSGDRAGAVGDLMDAAAVEFPVELLPGANTPRYPELLRNAGVEGEVRMRFVVDTLGAVEPGSITVLASTHPLFATAVREALIRQRFRPASFGNRRVRQLVEQPFQFSIRR